MARKKPAPVGDYLLFDVLYDDGMRTSNRKVPTVETREWEFDASVRAVIEAQDREIAERSGRRRGTITTITPSSTR